MTRDANAWTILLLATGSFAGSLWMFAAKKDSDTITKGQRVATMVAGFLFGSIFGAIFGHWLVEKWFADQFIAIFVYGASASVCTLLSGGFARALIELDVSVYIKSVLRAWLKMDDDNE
ncbi:MAG: hypothetical protein HKN36_08200 [Hellea sp.]|nr:hypothetical protein [Hellea sp.]